MESEYEIVRQRLDGSHCAYVLAEKGAGATFFDKMASDPKRLQEAAALRRVLLRLAEYGVGWGVDSGTVKFLKGGDRGILLCEVKVRRTVFRVMAYLHNRRSGPIILLFDFKGHAQRASGGIPDQVMEKGRKLAREAKRLCEREFGA